MKSYVVTFQQTDYLEVTVLATDEDDAIEKANIEDAEHVGTSDAEVRDVHEHVEYKVAQP